ncbi:MAG TPA: DnaJ domain-containing protein [Cyclobacteriaceae bacterium]|nr:DnaJ domain-containing protein [Cyclobacteriaceae bacterium]
MEDFHHKLNVSPNASEAQIKNAYRKLAKKYHPDISKEPDAEKRFVEITKAYEALLGKTPSRPTVTSYSSETSYSEEEIRRSRAQEYARMRYDEFKKNNDAFKRSWFYWPLKICLYSLVIGGYCIAGGMFLSALLAYYFDGFSGIAAFILFLFSSLFGKSIWDLHQGIKPYFKNYD